MATKRRVCTRVALLNCVIVADSQSLRLDDDVEHPEEDPFMAKLSFEVRERVIDRLKQRVVGKRCDKRV